MSPAPKGRSPVDTAAEDITALSTALSDCRRLISGEKIEIARRIGFAIGLDLVSKEHLTEANIESRIRSLFSRLQLEVPILRNWGPVVFVKHSVPSGIADEDQEVKHLKAAFGEGVLEGLISSPEHERMFVRHSISMPHLNRFSGDMLGNLTRRA